MKTLTQGDLDFHRSEEERLKTDNRWTNYTISRVCAAFKYAICTHAETIDQKIIERAQVFLSAKKEKFI